MTAGFRVFFALTGFLFLASANLAQAQGTEDGFAAWRTAFRVEAVATGVSADVFDAAFAGIEPDPDVLRAADNQSEFVRAIWDYLDRAVSDSRIENGIEKARLFNLDLSAMEAKWGVDPAILVAIWGLESSYGSILDNPTIVKSVIRSLATLAYQGEARSGFGKTQLLAALRILQSGDITPERMTGSWAGAMGHTQFIPTTYLAHAVDYTGDGKRDLWGSPEDALASAANYLAVSGWEKGKPSAVEVVLPESFDFQLADGSARKSVRDWAALGVLPAAGSAFEHPDSTTRVFLPAGATGPAFLIFRNFDVIKRYNNADAYALAITLIAARIRGGGGVQGAWPRHLTPLNRAQTMELQRLLTERGHDAGGVDGLMGPKTRAAIRAYQAALGKIGDGFATVELLTTLRPAGSSDASGEPSPQGTGEAPTNDAPNGTPENAPKGTSGQPNRP